MTIYAYLQQMDQDRLAHLLGDAQLADELPEMPLTTAAKSSLCPAELGRKLFGDTRGCEELGRSAGKCADCAWRFLRLDMPERQAP